MQVTQALQRASLLYPERTLTICGSRTHTVSEVADRVARLAAGLQSLGVGPGARVGMLSLNSDRYFEYLLAVPWAGGVVNPVNIRWSAAEVAYSLRDCGTDVLIVDDTFAPMVPVLRAQAPNLRRIVFCGDGNLPEDAVHYEDLIAASEPVGDAGRTDDDLYGVFYTGGTTGNPKGVVLTHKNMLASAMGSLVTDEIVGHDAVQMHAAPMFHLAGLAALIIGLLRDATHVFVPAFTAAGVLQSIQDRGVTDILLVPTMIQMLLDAPEAEGLTLPGVRRVLYGASPISETTLKRAFAMFPNVGFTQAYGMTELSPIATLLTPADHDDPSLLRSCGRPVAHSTVRILDPDGHEVPRGTVGEICVKGDNVMHGYWNQPAQTAAAIQDGWMHTGDGGYMDGRGYVFVVDRIKDMIISGGENVYSAEVENALAKHPAVAQVAVIGVPDDTWGERVHAVVVLHAGTTIEPDELRAHCRDLIAGYKVPRTFDFTDALPMSAAGKVLKRMLRDEHRATAGASGNAIP